MIESVLEVSLPISSFDTDTCHYHRNHTILYFAAFRNDWPTNDGNSGGLPVNRQHQLPHHLGLLLLRLASEQEKLGDQVGDKTIYQDIF